MAIGLANIKNLIILIQVDTTTRSNSTA